MVRPRLTVDSLGSMTAHPLASEWIDQVDSSMLDCIAAGKGGRLGYTPVGRSSE